MVEDDFPAPGDSGLFDLVRCLLGNLVILLALLSALFMLRVYSSVVRCI